MSLIITVMDFFNTGQYKKNPLERKGTTVSKFTNKNIAKTAIYIKYNKTPQT